MLLNHRSDPYGSFHLSLNKLPGDQPTEAPKTEWLNMGFWKGADSFPQACENLALKLIKAARYEAGDNVLDVGHGSGESLILQLSNPLIPRPSRLTGITSLKSHYRRSVARIKDFQGSDTASFPRTEVNLYHGDAVFRPTDVNHPLDPSSSSPTFDRIIALDCAYHFKSRVDFLRQSFARLSPGGRVTLADICFKSSPMDRWRTYLIVSLFGLMPKENAITVDQYRESLVEVGYTDVTVEDISEFVFPGFRAFLSSRGGLWWLFSCVIGCYVDAGARFVIISGSKIS
ncbi:hypothetical protein JAAARDRAFT_29711 [Jaapia argillacea MUCL 33604]|uniref:phosphoethanolamine N-methyltransferase n=1 Tax=Jaapia argillacea MUCL 33604 TaxID=933084 RepID=A0A067QJJ0_9AGAM|nr:hypothetical protein JAAARDRAFT_29711 [Jaapia argillacea MUCL 33604]